MGMNSRPPTTGPLFSNGAVPVPNARFDSVLPTLKNTELRFLLVVLRQTAGWRDGRHHTKARDWLSHRQLVVLPIFR